MKQERRSIGLLQAGFMIYPDVVLVCKSASIRIVCQMGWALFHECEISSNSSSSSNSSITAVTALQ